MKPLRAAKNSLLELMAPRGKMFGGSLGGAKGLMPEGECLLGACWAWALGPHHNPRVPQSAGGGWPVCESV